MGISTSKSETKQTVTPTAPAYVTDAARDYVGRVQDFANSDPMSRVAPVSQLQKQAFNAAKGLGGWQAAANAAAAAAGQAGSAPAAEADVFSYNAPTIGNAPQATAQTYETQGAGEAAQSQAQSLLDNLQDYYNPYQQQVIDAALADMDQSAGQTRAAQMAAGARNGALSGSRFGVAQALTEGELARARAATDAGLRAQGFNTAAGLSAQDAAQRQQNEQFNVGQQNQFGLADAQLRDAAARYAADANNQFSMFNTQNEFQRMLSQAGLDANAGQFNAGAQNQASLTNAQLLEQSRQRALQAAGLQGDIANSSASNARADAALQADIGAQQRAIEAQKLNADLAQLQAQGQLLGMTPYEALIGQNMTGVTKSNPGLFQSLLAIGNKAASAISGGMGG